MRKPVQDSVHRLCRILSDVVAGFHDFWHVWWSELEDGYPIRWLEFVGWITLIAVGIAWLLLQL